MQKTVGITAIAAFALALSATPLAAQSLNLMNYADTDGDGRVTPHEYEVFNLLAWDRTTRRAEKVLFDELDERLRQRCRSSAIDDDGYISRDAFRSSTAMWFHRLDRNGDGVLGEAEINDRIALSGTRGA